jgi:hypothetical protein
MDKNRLDYFLISEHFVGILKNVEYRKLGEIFDHKQCKVWFGKDSGRKNEVIFNSTLNSSYADNAGFLGCIDILNENRTEPDLEIRHMLKSSI